MDLITVNEEKCIKCGQCIKECPSFVLKMGEKGPEEVANTTCIARSEEHTSELQSQP